MDEMHFIQKTTRGSCLENDDFFSKFCEKSKCLLMVTDGITISDKKGSGRKTGEYLSKALMKSEILEMNCSQLEDLVKRLNAEVRSSEIGYATIALALIQINKEETIIRVLNVGDSRVYVIIGKEARLISKDHRTKISGNPTSYLGSAEETLKIHSCEIHVSNQKKVAIFLLTDGAYEEIVNEKEIYRMAQFINKHMYLHLETIWTNNKKWFDDNATLLGVFLEPNR